MASEPRCSVALLILLPIWGASCSTGVTGDLTPAIGAGGSRAASTGSAAGGGLGQAGNKGLGGQGGPGGAAAGTDGFVGMDGTAGKTSMADASREQYGDAPADTGSHLSSEDAFDAAVGSDGSMSRDSGGDSSPGDVPPGDGGYTVTPPHPCSSTSHFGAPTLVPGLNGPTASVTSARFSQDELVAYLGLIHGYQTEIYMSRRASRFDSFQPPTPLSTLNDPSAVDDTPTVTADGLTLFMESSRAGYYDIFESNRPSADVDFPAPTELLDLHVSAEGNPFVTPNGNALYFHRYDSDAADFDVYRVPILSTGFGPQERLFVDTSANQSDPVVSPDELVLYFYQSGQGLDGVWMATRTALTDPFGAPTSLPELNAPYPQASPNWISPDGCRIYVQEMDTSGGYLIYVAERAF